MPETITQLFLYLTCRYS